MWGCVAAYTYYNYILLHNQVQWEWCVALLSLDMYLLWCCAAAVRAYNNAIWTGHLQEFKYDGKVFETVSTQSIKVDCNWNSV